MSPDPAIHFFWRDRSVASRFRTGVSLHSHTLFSREGLTFIPRYAGRIPIVRQAVAARLRRYYRETGLTLDFSRAWWTPPLPPREAHDVEARQIEEQLNLPALVSLTDHDNIEAGLRLRVVESTADSPLSVEWTVPFETSFFHLGVHNLPASRAGAIMDEFRILTANPVPERVQATLAELNQYPHVLIVCNHPLWDEKGIGIAQHQVLLERFLERFGRAIHALELNGWRTWAENRSVIRIARGLGLPLISGGDRHGREPNANLNLTNASSFPGFVEEVRLKKRSHVLFMPQYKESRTYRVLRTVCDILRHDERHELGWAHWSDRIFYHKRGGGAESLTDLWSPRGAPVVVRSFIGLMTLLEKDSVRAALRSALLDKERVVL